MKRQYIAGVVFFMMKYFFDIEREIIQQLVTSAQVRILDVKTLLSGLHQLIVLHK